MLLHLGGHLSYFDTSQRVDFEVQLAGRQYLKDVLTGLNIPAGEVFLVSINGEVIALEDAWVQDEDQVRLYPAMGGG